MPEFPSAPFGSFPPSKKVLPEVAKIRRAIQHGALEQRGKLIEKLGSLAASYATEGRFDDSLKAFDEIIGLTETLLEEGNPQITERMLKAVFPIAVMARIRRVQHDDLSMHYEDAFFHRTKKCMEMLPEQEFLGIKNEWATVIHQRAEILRKNQSHIAAIALLDESLAMFEPLLEPESEQYSELKPILENYRSRGLWKLDIGDSESGIADLLHYEKLAQSANAVLERNLAVTRERNSSAGIMQNGKMVLRISAEDLVEFYASSSFQEDRYNAMLRLANAYVARADKEKAFEYFDKALAVTQVDETVREHAGFLYCSAPMDIPCRKGHVLVQFHRFEEALEQFDLAMENVKELLQLDRDEFLADLENSFAEISRARAGALRNLGRLEEAKAAVETARQLFAQVLRTVELAHADEDGDDGTLDFSQVPFLQTLPGGSRPGSVGGTATGPGARLFGGKEPDDNPLSMKNLLAGSARRAQQPLRKMVSGGVELDERKIYLQSGALHNEAMMEVERARIEMNAGHWRKALRHLLKARFVIDSPIIVSFPEAKRNILNVYSAIAKVYMFLKEYDKSQTWYERTLKFARKLLDEGEHDTRNFQWGAWLGLGDLHSEQKQHDKALVEYNTAFTMQVRMSEELEAALEGLDREHLRVHDNQKLMPLAALYQAQVETIRGIENQIFALNTPDQAESWARIERETFEKFRALLLQPEQSDMDYSWTIASCAVMLRWAGEEEKYRELSESWIARHKDSFKTEDEARAYLNDAMATRLKDLYALTDFHDGSRLCSRAYLLISRGQFREAYETAKVFRSFLVHEQEQEQHQNPPLIKREFLARHLAMLDDYVRIFRDHVEIDEEESVFRNHPYNPDEVRAILDIIEEEEAEAIKEDEPDEDENAALYERDFDDAMSNDGMLFKMLDAYSGNHFADEMLAASDRRHGTMQYAKAKVGRNDPCPCGSGKKYKKCCMGK